MHQITAKPKFQFHPRIPYYW